MLAFNIKGGRVQEKTAKLEAELNFLSALEQGRVVTQMTLSKRIAVSVGLINALLKRAMHKGYVKASAAPYKRYAYYLTPQGFTEKSRLVAKYLEISLDFFRKARQEYIELFLRARVLGMKRIVFAGSGELVEIALSAIREAELEVQFIFDPGANGESISRLTVVRDLAELSGIDGIIVTETRAPQQMFDLLAAHVPHEKILTPELLHITRARLDFRPKVASQ